MSEEEEEKEEQQSEAEEEEEIQHESSLSEDELIISPLRGARDREILAREKDLQILTRHSEISNPSPSIISNTSIPSSSSLLQIGQRQKIKVDAYRMPKNSDPEKKLYDRLHEAVQLDYVNFGPEILSDPMKLAEIVNKRWREIFQQGHSMPLPDNTIERVCPSIYFVDDSVQTEVIRIWIQCAQIRFGNRSYAL
jgi:hypothetical protein